MPAFVSEGKLINADRTGSWSGSWGGIRTPDRWLDYAAIYRGQSNVRWAVDFISRNIAQLGLHTYKRVGENDRLRLRDHPLAAFIHRPNGWTTRHRWVYSILADKGIWGESFWVKTKGSGRDPLSVVRVPPQLVEVTGGLKPMGYKINLYPDPLELTPEQVLHFRNYNPNSSIRGLSPIESLRLVLEEDLASVEHRRDMWTNSGRQPLIIKRPKSAGTWTPEVARRFSEQFTEAIRSPRSLTTPILEDDMSLETLSFNAEQNQYTEGRQLTREEVATSYFVPLSMAGVAGASSTFASVREYHQILYTDTLGPWIDELETELDLQLFPDFADMNGVYVEFNIMEKLQGSFLDQVDILYKAIGRPFMTADEGRARLNLSSMGGEADTLAVAVNIDPTGVGGTPRAVDQNPPMVPAQPTNGRVHAPIPA